MAVLYTDESLLAAVKNDLIVQNAIHSPTVQPLTRLAVAAKLDNAPSGVADPLWDSVPNVGSLFRHRPEEGLSRDTEVKIAYDATELCVRVFNHGRPARLDYKKEFWTADTTEIFFDPTHDHLHYLHFVIVAGGKRHSFIGWKSCGTQRWENRGEMDALDIKAWQGDLRLEKDHWVCQFTIPFDTLEAQPETGKPFGFNAMRQRCDFPPEWYFWNFTHRGPHSPFGFGDLYFGTPPRVHVEKADLGELQLWDNRGALRVRNCSGKKITGSLAVTVKIGKEEEKTTFSAVVPIEIPANTPEPCCLPFSFVFDPVDFKYQNLHLEMRDSQGDCLWAGAFRSAYEHGCMLHIDDRREGPAATNPDPLDPKFLEKKRSYIMRRIPRFVRKTTAQGAPSDFTLAAADGSIVFDLMKSGILQRMADYIYSSYDNDIDRLLGATMFVHQPSVVRYAHMPSQLGGHLSPLSIIRFGNSQCNCQNEVLCGLLEKMRCEATGRPYQTCTTTIFAHVVADALFNGKWAHLDASLGRFYFLPGNTELASTEELVANPALGLQQSPQIAYMFAETKKLDFPFCGHTNTGIWPPGAPVE